MQENSAFDRGSLAPILIAMTLIASCERESGRDTRNTIEPSSERTAPATELHPTEGSSPPSKDPQLRIAQLARRAAAGDFFVQEEFSQLVADYSESYGLSLGDSCLRLCEELGEDLEAQDREVLLVLLHRALIGNYKEQNIFALGLPPGMPRTKLIAGHLNSLRSDSAIAEMKVLHEGLGPGRDRTSAAVEIALTTLDRDGLAAAAESATELALPEEREAALVGLAHEFILQDLDQESAEHRAGYERLMELARAEGETVHRRVQGRFNSTQVEVISPEELEERKRALNIPK